MSQLLPDTVLMITISLFLLTMILFISYNEIFILMYISSHIVKYPVIKAMSNAETLYYYKQGMKYAPFDNINFR